MKTHDLEVLLHLSGIEARIRTKYLAEWSLVIDWNPEKRYQSASGISEQKARDMVAAASRLVKAL